MRDDGPNDDYCLESKRARKPELRCGCWGAGTLVIALHFAHALALALVLILLEVVAADGVPTYAAR